MLNCLVGIPRPQDDAATVRRTVVQNLRDAASALQDAGIKLLIEPVNDKDIPGFWLTRAEQGIGLIDEVGSDNLFLQYDLYHQSRMDGELTATWRRYQRPHRPHPGRGQSRTQRAGHGRDQFPLPVRRARPRGLRGLDRLRVQAGGGDERGARLGVRLSRQAIVTTETTERAT